MKLGISKTSRVTSIPREDRRLANCLPTPDTVVPGGRLRQRRGRRRAFGQCPGVGHCISPRGPPALWHVPDRVFVHQAGGAKGAPSSAAELSVDLTIDTRVLKGNAMFEKEVEDIFRDLELGDEAGAGWMWNPATKRFERAGKGGPDCLIVGGKDLGHAAGRRIYQ
jgi:hypothetical protein